MTKYYCSEQNHITEIESPREDCWISLVNPTEAEVAAMVNQYGIDTDAMRSALDTDERSRIETDENYTMVLVNIPNIETHNDKELYDTIPLSVFVVKKAVITVSLEKTPILEAFANGTVRDFNPAMRSRFVLQILYRTSSLFLQYLRSIDRQSEIVENKLHKSTQNRELIELLKLEKSLVYFTTALRSNEVVLEKLFKNDNIKKYQEDEELLECGNEGACHNYSCTFCSDYDILSVRHECGCKGNAVCRESLWISYYRINRSGMQSYCCINLC